MMMFNKFSEKTGPSDQARMDGYAGRLRVLLRSEIVRPGTTITGAGKRDCAFAAAASAELAGSAHVGHTSGIERTVQHLQRTDGLMPMMSTAAPTAAAMMMSATAPATVMMVMMMLATPAAIVVMMVTMLGPFPFAMVLKASSLVNDQWCAPAPAAPPAAAAIARAVSRTKVASPTPNGAREQ